MYIYSDCFVSFHNADQWGYNEPIDLIA